MLGIENRGAGLAGHEGDGGGEDSIFCFCPGFTTGGEGQINGKREPRDGERFVRGGIGLRKGKEIFGLS